MTDVGLERLLDAVRELLPEDPHWTMLNVVPQAARTVPPNIPDGYARFLACADGAALGVVALYRARDVERMQIFADGVQDIPVRLGRERWFCFGAVSDEPLFIDRTDGSVWGFPDAGVIWWQSDRFERYAGSFEDFVRDWLLGPRYAQLTGVGPTDQWSRLIAAMNRG